RPVGNAVTSDPAIRRAINLGLDRELIVEVALHGHGTPAFGPADGLPWAGADDRVAFDPAAAKAILDAAGWTPGPDGIRARDGAAPPSRSTTPPTTPPVRHWPRPRPNCCARWGSRRLPAAPAGTPSVGSCIPSR